MPLHMRLPEAQGLQEPNRIEFQVVNVADIEPLVPRGRHGRLSTIWSPRARSARTSPVKVLGDGKLTVKVDVSVNKFTGSAKEKIAAAGGSATEV